MFLQKLNEKYPSDFGVRGYTELLIEIFRNTNLSLNELSYILQIPIPECCKMVNLFIEKEILSRIEEGILYTEKGMQFIESELGLYGHGLQTCEICEGFPVEITNRFDILLNTLKLKINLPSKNEINKTIKTSELESLILQSLIFYKYMSLEGQNITFVNVDPSLIYTILHLYLSEFPKEVYYLPKHISILGKSVDYKIIKDMINSLSTEEKSKVSFYEFNEKSQEIPKLPPQDVVIFYPYYSGDVSEQIIKSLNNSIKILQNNFEHQKEIYLFQPPTPIGELYNMQKTITEFGLWIKDSIKPCDYLSDKITVGNSKNLIHIKTTKSTVINRKPIKIMRDETNLNYQNYSYDMLINVKYCPDCFKHIIIGKGFNYNSEEDLKQKGCIYCQSIGPFINDENSKNA